MKFFALFINLLGILALLFIVIYAQVPILLLYISGEEVAIWGLIAFGFCLILLPVLLISAEIFSWQSYVKRDYANSISAYKWVFLDVLIIMFFGFAMSAGWIKK